MSVLTGVPSVTEQTFLGVVKKGISKLPKITVAKKLIYVELIFMSRSCLVWFVNCTDTSNKSHSSLTTGSFWSSVGASKCFSPESAERFSISSLLALVSASCNSKLNPKITGRGRGKGSWRSGFYMPWISVTLSGLASGASAKWAGFSICCLVRQFCKCPFQKQSSSWSQTWDILEVFLKCWNNLSYCGETKHWVFTAAPHGGGGEGGWRRLLFVKRIKKRHES